MQKNNFNNSFTLTVQNYRSMKKLGFIVAILLFQIVAVNAQQNNTRQRMSFKSIVIQNGDTIVTEKNFDSDDPNANLSDSIPFGNGSFQFSFGDGFSNDFFGNYDPLSSNPFFQSPFMNDSLLNQFFGKSFQMDTTVFNRTKPFETPEFYDNLVPYTGNSGSYNLSDFKVAILPESNIMNVTFKQSPVEITELVITDSKGKGLYTEQFEKSDGYYVRQIELSKLGKGKFTITLKQGAKEQTKSVTVN